MFSNVASIVISSNAVSRDLTARDLVGACCGCKFIVPRQGETHDVRDRRTHWVPVYQLFFDALPRR